MIVHKGQKILILPCSLRTGLSPSGHATRTLLITKKSPDQMLVQVGPNANIDSATTEASSGRSQARIFSVNALSTGRSSVAYTTGQLFAYGLRNSIGWAEEPSTGGIVSYNLDKVEEETTVNIIRSGLPKTPWTIRSVMGWMFT